MLARRGLGGVSHCVLDDVAHVLVGGDVVGLPATSRDPYQSRGS